MRVKSCEKDFTPVTGEFIPTQIENPFGTDVMLVQSSDMYLSHFSMRVSEGHFTQNAVLMNTTNSQLDLLGSCLFPKGNFTSSTRNLNQVIESYEGTQNFKFDPQNEYRHWIAAYTPFHIIHFSADPDYFLQLLPDECWADELRNKIINKERFLGNKSVPIAIAQERALQTIFNCPLAGKLGELLMETAITQIIVLQLSLLFQKQPSSAPALNKRDLEVIHGVKEYLTKTFLNDHSLEGLATGFGTNTNKLITLFKKAFGQSIFEFINDLKMNYAQVLLQEQQLPVTEVARTLGYKNPNHFSTAFKRKFGMNPSHVKVIA